MENNKAEELIEYKNIRLPNTISFTSDQREEAGSMIELLTKNLQNDPVEIFGKTQTWFLFELYKRLVDLSDEIIMRETVDEDAYVLRTMRDRNMLLLPFGVYEFLDWSEDDLDKISENQKTDESDEVDLNTKHICDNKLSFKQKTEWKKFLFELYSIDPQKRTVNLSKELNNLAALVVFDWFLLGGAKDIFLSDVKVN